MIKTAFVHIGQGKTGTSALQAFLATNRAGLAEKGFLVPRSPGPQRHTLLSLYAKSDEAVINSPAWRRSGFATPAEMRGFLESELRRETAESGCPNLVLSDESLYGAGIPAIRGVRELLTGLVERFVIVVYLRRQDEHAVSRYKQTLREGKAHTIYEYIQRDRNIDKWRYYEILKRISEKFPDVGLVVRPYHRERLRTTSLIDDFCNAIGAPVGGWTAIASDVNPSLDAPCSEFLRRYNERNGRAPQPILRGLVRASDGAALRLPEDVRRRFMEIFRESNERLVAEFMPGCEDVFLEEPAPPRGICQEEVTEDQLRAVAERIPDLDLGLLEFGPAAVRASPTVGLQASAR